MKSKEIAIVGAGISGVAAGSILKNKGHNVTIFEKNSKPGGLIRCDVVEGNLFHRVGGHVFNAKDKDVSDWFWNHFDRDKEFLRAERNAKILLNGKIVGYPLENHLYALEPDLVRNIVSELLTLQRRGYTDPYDYPDFAEFLKGNFGATLYNLYFKPYNEKIWRTDLSSVPMHWLEGKLPMPDFNSIFLNNITRLTEKEMVHSTFYYARNGGSQFIIDRLAKGLRIVCEEPVTKIRHERGKWLVNNETFDNVVYTGDIRALDRLLSADRLGVSEPLKEVAGLRSNGTSNMLCETDESGLSWLYLPDPRTRAHRIIYTGNFSDSNNAEGKRKTCVVEFSGKVEESEMIAELGNLPGNLQPIAHNYEANSYIIQQQNTRDKIAQVKRVLNPHGFYLFGRFAEWEYYNMDKAIKSTFSLHEHF